MVSLDVGCARRSVALVSHAGLTFGRAVLVKVVLFADYIVFGAFQWARSVSPLRLLDPDDPVKYDFALCHTRMSGDCRDRRDPAVCTPCGLRVVCRHWRGRHRA